MFILAPFVVQLLFSMARISLLLRDTEQEEIRSKDKIFLIILQILEQLFLVTDILIYGFTASN